MRKKKWIAPQLLVLMRGEPGESVLSGCKSGIEMGPGSQYTRCGYLWGSFCYPECNEGLES